MAAQRHSKGLVSAVQEMLFTCGKWVKASFWAFPLLASVTLEAAGVSPEGKIEHQQLHHTSKLPSWLEPSS